MKYDSLDVAILGHLYRNARTPLTRVAGSLGVGLATVHRRLLRLQEVGLVKGFATKIDPAHLGLSLTAFIRLRVGDSPAVEKGFNRLQQFPEVEEVHVITGNSDILIKVRARDTSHLRRLVAGIHEAMGSTRATTEVCLDSPVDREPPYHLVMESGT